MISNPNVNPNSHIYSEELSVRSALISSEMSALSFTNLYPDSRNIKGESKFIINLYRNYKNSIDPTKPKTYLNGLVITRNYDFEKGFTIPLFGSKNMLLDRIYPDNNFYEFLNKSNELYDNGNVRMYLND